MKIQNGAVIRCLFFAVTLFCIAQARASVPSPVYVYNSFGPGDTFDEYAYWGVYGASGSGGYVGHAESFVPAFSGDLQTVQVALSRLASGGTGAVNFRVAADNGGIPGSVLESFMNVAAPDSGSSSYLVTLNSTAAPLLQAGATYWLCAEPAQDTTGIGWFVNDQGYANNYAQENPPGVWASAPDTIGANGVFNVSVVPVPETSAAGLMLFGMGCFSIMRFRLCKVSRDSK